MTDPTKRAREIAAHTVASAGAHGELPSGFDIYPFIDTLTAAILAFGTSERERGARDMRERAVLVLSEVTIANRNRADIVCDATEAIAALPLTDEGEG